MPSSWKTQTSLFNQFVLEKKRFAFVSTLDKTRLGFAHSRAWG